MAVLIACCFGAASWYGIGAIYDGYIIAGRTLLHPSHDMRRAIGVALGALISFAYFAWAAIMNEPWEIGG
ncbi:MAG TPA: hypothetical protein VGM82_00375 [Gemmatimonadaceae bacterium]